ncbi:hypothetical protein CEY16_11095 [Halalkalibacillus sediminis]|uniref:DUF3784 domain-containing protein n=1 Tax=Halalkalibacillus sediminis TaxID=2018042 RepID=A0A2I0QSH5_9BACI|nr:DUF3784 domain-containing protein [Halalkalibacillus sediminis]PKR77276.1 hypothetical protein CEY16_11095 [Halalkalibacillus sediminis]
MNTGTLIFLIVMGFALLIHGGLAYLIVKKKEYSLLSGFSNRPEEEKEYLKSSGYTDAVEKMLKYTFYFLLFITIAGVVQVPYIFEIGIALFLIVIMSWTIYIQKYEVPRKRKKAYWLTGSITGVVFIGVAVLTYVGLKDPVVTIDDESFEVSGVYGVEWELEEVEEVQLLDELPEVIARTNGFAFSGVLKGNFLLEKPYGGGKLFVRTESSPYLYVESQEEYLIVNHKSKEITEGWFDELNGN